MALSGYKQLYLPDYYCATKAGYVAEHRYVAEQKLGRHLKKGEIVHHIDRNKMNNDPDNIMVFRSANDHTRYHTGGILIENEDGSYSSVYEKARKVCPYCNRIFVPKRNSQVYCSKECSDMAKVKTPRPSKKQLKSLLLEFNMSQIAKMYDVSEMNVRHWCTSYKLPCKLKDIKRMRDRARLKAIEKQEATAAKYKQKEVDALRHTRLGE